MSTSITYLGHSGILFRHGPYAVAIDPFLTGNPVATMKAADLKPTHIALSHGHGDHIGDTVAIAKASGATVYAAFELAEHLKEQGLAKVEDGNPGGRIKTSFGFIAFTRAYHSSSLDGGEGKGKYLGAECGIVVRFSGAGGASGQGFTAYHCGDTDLFSDMRLIGEVYRPDVAFIPIGDRYTMGPELGTRAAELIGAPVAVPIHYNTWPPITVDVADFAPKSVRVRVMKPGERWDSGV